jgi:hypothetical protein
VFVLASFFTEFATGMGGVAATVAVGAFIGQIRPGLAEASDARVRREAVTGGVPGFLLAAGVFVLSAAVW